MYEKFMEDLGPTLKQALDEGWSAEKIYTHPKVEALMAARAISIALRDPQSNTSLSAIKEVMDRAKGKAKESKTVEHKLTQMSDEQLDAALASLMNPEDEQLPIKN
jgi:membrane glycosyltransferase